MMCELYSLSISFSITLLFLCKKKREIKENTINNDRKNVTRTRSTKKKEKAATEKLATISAVGAAAH